MNQDFGGQSKKAVDKMIVKPDWISSVEEEKNSECSGELEFAMIESS
jgi:hypothetical protein